MFYLFQHFAQVRPWTVVNGYFSLSFPSWSPHSVPQTPTPHLPGNRNNHPLAHIRWGYARMNEVGKDVSNYPVCCKVLSVCWRVDCKTRCWDVCVCRHWPTTVHEHLLFITNISICLCLKPKMIITLILTHMCTHTYTVYIHIHVYTHTHTSVSRVTDETKSGSCDGNYEVMWQRVNSCEHFLLLFYRACKKNTEHFTKTDHPTGSQC